jgi:hypothetical protein
MLQKKELSEEVLEKIVRFLKHREEESYGLFRVIIEIRWYESRFLNKILEHFDIKPITLYNMLLEYTTRERGLKKFLSLSHFYDVIRLYKKLPTKQDLYKALSDNKSFRDIVRVDFAKLDPEERAVVLEEKLRSVERIVSEVEEFGEAEKKQVAVVVQNICPLCFLGTEKFDLCDYHLSLIKSKINQ